MYNYNLICFDRNNMHWPYLQKEVNIYSLYKGKNSKNRLRSLFNRLISYTPFVYLRFSEWIKKIKDENEAFVFFDECQFGPFLRRLINKYSNRCVVHLSNPAEKIRYLGKIFKCRCNIYSFSKRDCEKYKLRFKPCIIPNLSSFGIKQSKPIYDLYFIGQNKQGRKAILDRIKNKYPNLTIRIDLLDANEFVPYQEFVLREAKAKCILEILQISQFDETLREIEAMVLRKKILTNNSNLIDAEKIFGDNILIFDDNNLPSEQKLLDFINRPFSQYDHDYVKQHCVPHWFENIEFNGKDGGIK